MNTINPPINDLINPPADVQQSVAAVIAACGKWQNDWSRLPPSPPQTTAPGLTEAQVCHFIQHPEAEFWAAINVVLFLVVTVVALTWAFRLHCIPGAVWRLAKRVGGSAGA